MMQHQPGIYIHIPFCYSKCGYCDFYSTTDLYYIDSFIDAILTEIKLSSKQLNTSEVFDTIYFGGGTPSLLTVKQIEKILNSLQLHFNLKENTDITLEVNPGTLNNKILEDIQNLNINRLSIGVQSFIDEELQFLDRIHTVQQAEETINSARSAGFKEISIDLIFALPKQTLKDWIYSLDKALMFRPEHISVYNLTYEKGTPFHKMKKTGKIIAQDEETELLFYKTAIEKLRNNGYIQYEISNFALNLDLVSKHNVKYWNHTDYLGFGPSAHSFWINKRWANRSSIDSYILQLNKNQYPDRMEEMINKKTKEFEKIFLSLRTNAGLNFNEFNDLFQCSFKDKYKSEIDKLLSTGLACIDDNKIYLTSEGLYIYDEIITNFARN